MMQWNQIEFCLRSGVSSTIKHKTMSIVSVIIIASCLLLISTLGSISANVTHNMNMLQKDNVMLAFVDDACEAEIAMSLGEYIADIPGVKTVEYISNEQIFEEYVAENGDDYHISPAVFRNRYSVELQSGYKASEVSALVDEVQYIAEVRVDEAVVEGFAMIKKAITFVLTFLTIAMVTVSVVIIVNTIKLAVHSRRKEMYIESIVGAYDAFISGPFMVEGCIIGLVGSLIGFLMFCLCYQGILIAVSDLAMQEIMEFVPLTALTVKTLLLNLLFGVGIGVIGSSIVSKRVLKRGVVEF